MIQTCVRLSLTPSDTRLGCQKLLLIAISDRGCLDPLLRVMVEAPEDEVCRRCVAEVVDVIRARGHIVSEY